MSENCFDKKELFTVEDTLSKYIGTEVWLTDNRRGWATIVSCSYNLHDGFTFEWEQYDDGPDGRELYDDGIFGLNDVGSTVFVGEEAEKKCHEADERVWNKVEW